MQLLWLFNFHFVAKILTFILYWKDDDGQTPLHYAVVCEREAIAKYLVKQNADTDLKDNDGNTPSDLCEANWPWLKCEGKQINWIVCLLVSSSLSYFWSNSCSMYYMYMYNPCFCQMNLNEWFKFFLPSFFFLGFWYGTEEPMKITRGKTACLCFLLFWNC